MEPTLDSLCLSSDDPELNNRLQSINSLSTANLTENFISEELIPRILTYLDDTEEVLLTIINQIVNLKRFTETEKHIYTLFIPLEILAGSIEDSVKSAAIHAILSIMTHFSLTEAYLFQLLSNLMQSSNFDSKSSALKIIYHLFSTLTLESQAKSCDFIYKLFTVATIPLKHEIASLIISLSESDAEKSKFSQFLTMFLQDSEDEVRIQGIRLLKVLDLDIKDYSSVLFDRSWRVRYYIAKNIADYFCEGNTEMVCEAFVRLLEDEELEVRVAGFESAKAVCEGFLNPEQMERVLEVFKTAGSKTNDINVIRSILRACSAMDRQTADSYMLEIIQKLVKCESLEIELCILQELESITAITTQEYYLPLVVPIVTKLLLHKSWKTRITVLKLLPKIGKLLGYANYLQYLHSSLMSLLCDLIHAVRSEAINCISVLAEEFSSEWVDFYILPEVIEKSNSEFCVNRITSINLLIGIHKKVDFDRTANEINKLVERLAQDKVANVRICVGKLFRVTKNLREGCQARFDLSIETLKADQDRDVQNIVKDL